ncbi:hypothetical protein ILUMI_22696 [Ignelater luminosus]|uniref:Peptidase S1 domain-containing protein n=1 Tax=Ignelater luminosus TaxID=2038154 RepID=A0A8K0CA59_IGNLU|nr:hypothetical protein ILUMI_22696 [Ignelater luminosus]
MFTITLTNCGILIVFICCSIHLAESCFKCEPHFLPASEFAVQKRRAFWWKNQAKLEHNAWQRKKAAALAPHRPTFKTSRTSVATDDSDLNIPGVINPTWEAPIPKFNCMIITRMADIDTPICSGALISYSFVLTVGENCLLNEGIVYSPDDLVVRFISSTSSAIDKLVVKVVLHEGCCQAGNYLAHNDIALLHLETQIYEKNIQPAKITKRTVLFHPFVNDLWDLSNCRVYNMAVEFRDAIWFVRTRFISTDICDKIIPMKSMHKLKMTCVTYYHMGSKDCQTDQGSPLSYKGELIGLLIYKHFCGSPSSVALFVNIGIHSQWIRKHVQVISNSHESV